MMLSQLVIPLLLLIQLSDGNIINEKVQYEQLLHRLKRGGQRYQHTPPNPTTTTRRSKHFPPNQNPTTVPTTTTTTTVPTTTTRRSKHFPPNQNPTTVPTTTTTTTVPTTTTTATVTTAAPNLCGLKRTQGGVTTIDHPGTGGDYDNSQNCTWTVCTNTPGVIVNITRIDIERSSSCALDALTIQSRRYCGVLRGTVEVATIQGCVTVRFTSDSSITGSGFRIEIRPLHSFSATTTVPTSTTTRPRRSNVCGLKRTQGNVTTIDHPVTGGDYGNNQNCAWTVCTNTPGVDVNITRIDIERSSSCALDALTIGSRRYCGVVRRNVEVATIQGCVTVRFTSDSSITGSGFRIEIRPLHNFSATTTVPTSTTTRPRRSNVCGLKRTQGNVTTIDHPGTGDDYGNNQNCAWTVCTNTPGVNVNITRIDIETLLPSCSFDALTIGSRRYCGVVRRNVEVATIQGCVIVRFTSDSSITGSGFRIEIRPLHNFTATTTLPTSTTTRPRSTNVCGLERRQSGVTTIDHPGSGRLYGNNQNCTWTVCTNTPGVIINITRIDIENNRRCRYDVLTIQKNRYCGQFETNFEVTTYTGCVRISFTSDGSISGTGFSLTITPKQYQDGDTIVNPDGKVLIYNNGTWGVICPDQWGDYEVQVACRGAGYQYGIAMYLPRPPVNTTVEYSVQCTGEERNIRSCDVQYTDECSTTNRAGVFCGSIPLRLVDGTNSNNGRIQMLFNNTWAYLCIPNNIYNDAVNAMCQQLGFKTGDAEIIAKPRQFRDEFWTNVFGCLRYRRPLDQCVTEWRLQRSCQYGLHKLYCYGSVRLDTGYRNSTGAVLVYNNREYKTVCREGFDHNAVNVACRELGFPSGGRLLPGQYFIVNRTMINKRYTCTGNESSLVDCRTSYTSRTCSPVAAVACVDDQNPVCGLERRQSGVTTIDHPGSGRLYGNNQNCTWTVCTNTPGVIVNITRIDIETSSSCSYDVLTIQKNRYCGNSERNFEVTTYTGCVRISFSSDEIFSGTGFALTITPKQYQDGDTIVNPDGKVLIYNNGTWGVICPDQWGDYEVQVACRGAGYQYGVAVYVPRPAVNTPVVYSVQCTGGERNIRSCDVQYTDECSTTNRAGAFCGSNPLRLVNGTNSNNGRVQILFNNTWAYLCIPYAVYDDAVNAICQQFGYKTGDFENLHVITNFRVAYWVNFFRCLNNRHLHSLPLDHCRYNEWRIRRFCQFGAKTLYCYGLVRLDGGYINSTGAVLVYDNREYKTVCRDGFDQNAVNVTCRELGFPPGGRLLPEQYSIVNRTMINKRYTCIGNESSLVDCRTSYTSRTCSSVAAVACLDDQNPVCGLQRRQSDVTTIDYPGTGRNYGNNQNCSWTVCTYTPGVNVNITRIDIESSSSCAYDALTIQSRRYCGTVRRNVEVATTLGCVTVRFTSDGTITRSGFRIEIRPLHDFTGTTTLPTTTTTRPRSTNVCGLERRQSGVTTIDHPGSGRLYGNNQNCTWTVCTNTPGVIINITRIDIESSSTCTFDVLKIQKNRYCGQFETNFEVTTYTGCVRISFTSDGSISGTGFSLTITPKQYQDGDTIVNPDGKVLIYNNGTWGVICPDQWGDYEVQVACRGAGYLYGVAVYLPRPPVNTTDKYSVQCTGEERNIRYCDVQYTDECSTTNRAGAFCSSDLLRLVNGTYSNNGRVQILFNNTWAYLCIPSNTYRDAVNAICQQFGYKAGDLEIIPRTRSLGDEFWVNLFSCLADGRPLDHCRYESWNIQRSCRFGLQTVYCYGSVRLETGYRNSTGAVLVYNNREYKTVCGDGFNQNAVNVVCRELGFPSGGRLLLGQYSIVNRTILNKRYTCTGNESSLVDCGIRYPRQACSSVAAVSCVVDDQNSEPGCNVPSILADLGNIKQEAIATVNEANDVVARLMALLSKIRRN